MRTTVDTSAIAEACGILKGPSKLAAIAGVKPPTVSEWLSGKRRVPQARCPLIERATGISRRRLRPDIDWDLYREGEAAVHAPQGGLLAHTSVVPPR